MDFIGKLLIDGKLVSAQSGLQFDCVDPSVSSVFGRIADAGVLEMREAIVGARKQFDEGDWRHYSLTERGIYLQRIAKLIRDHAAELAQLESRDVGKTIKHTTFIDVPTCAETFDYFGKLNSTVFSQERYVAAPVKSLIEREPIGVVAAIIPWNYPLIMAAWKIAPAIIAGNTIILKPSSKACASVMRLAELIVQAGLPAGVVNIVPTTDYTAVAHLSTDEWVDKITFTGGTQTGKEIMRASASTVKKLTLELGGKSPNIVCADCDLEAAIGGTMSAIFMNQGQMCVAGSRLLLEAGIYDRFLDELAARTKKLKLGNALDYATDFGPLVNQAHRDSVLKFIQKGVDEGARILCGGKIPEEAKLIGGAFLEPTILCDVTPDMFVAQEEAFGPVLSVLKFSDEEEAIRIANNSKYGLAASIWTKDKKKARHIARQLQCGTVWINTYGGFYNETPFGGYKQSGIGRELGIEGLYEYTQVKHICEDQTPGGRPLVSGWF